MTDLEAQLRELMKVDAAVYRVRNQIAEKTDPASKKAKGGKPRGITEAKPTEELPK